MNSKKGKEQVLQERAVQAVYFLQASEQRKRRGAEVDKSKKTLIFHDRSAVTSTVKSRELQRGGEQQQRQQDAKKENLHLKSLLERERRLSDQLNRHNAELRSKLKTEATGHGALKREASKMQRELLLAEEDRKHLLKLVTESEEKIAALREENKALRRRGRTDDETETKADGEFFGGCDLPRGRKHKTAERMDCKGENVHPPEERAARDADVWRAAQRETKLRYELDKLKKVLVTCEGRSTGASTAEKTRTPLQLHRDVEETLTKVILQLRSVLVKDRHHGGELKTRLGTEEPLKKENLLLRSLLMKEKILTEQLRSDNTELKKKTETDFAEEAAKEENLYLQSLLVKERCLSEQLNCKVGELKKKLEAELRGQSLAEEAAKKDNLHFASLLEKERRLGEQLRCDVAGLKKRLEGEVQGRGAAQEALKKENVRLKSLLQHIRHLSQISCSAVRKVQTEVQLRSVLKRELTAPPDERRRRQEVLQTNQVISQRKQMQFEVKV